MDLVYCYKLRGELKLKLFCSSYGSVAILVYTHKCIFTECIGNRENNWFSEPLTESKTSYTTYQQACDQNSGTTNIRTYGILSETGDQHLVCRVIRGDN
jgi:hypothetical protein